MANSMFEYRTPYEMLIAKRYPGSMFAIYDISGLIRLYPVNLRVDANR